MYVAPPAQRPTRRTGVDIALESGLEWRVFKIENSGQEIYFRYSVYFSLLLSTLRAEVLP